MDKDIKDEINRIIEWAKCHEDTWNTEDILNQVKEDMISLFEKQNLAASNKIKINFNKRNESVLHCRFCKEEYKSHSRIPARINLYETSPTKGIVCEHCKKHLKMYIK